MMSLLVAATLAGAVPASGMFEHLAVEARYVREPHPELRFVVRSTHSEPLSVFEADLPWGNPHSVRLRFLTSSGDPACPLYTSPIADPTTEAVTLMPGELLEGAVRLEDYCPAFLAVNQTAPVTVTWEYCPVYEGRCSEDAHGTVVVERNAAEQAVRADERRPR